MYTKNIMDLWENFPSNFQLNGMMKISDFNDTNPKSLKAKFNYCYRFSIPEWHGGEYLITFRKKKKKSLLILQSICIRVWININISCDYLRPERIIPIITITYWINSHMFHNISAYLIEIKILLGLYCQFSFLSHLLKSVKLNIA